MIYNKLLKFTFAVFAICLIIAAVAFNVEQVLISGIFFAIALVCAFIMVFFNKLVTQSNARSKGHS